MCWKFGAETQEEIKQKKRKKRKSANRRFAKWKINGDILLDEVKIHRFRWHLQTREIPFYIHYASAAHRHAATRKGQTQSDADVTTRKPRRNITFQSVTHQKTAPYALRSLRTNPRRAPIAHHQHEIIIYELPRYYPPTILNTISNLQTPKLI